MSAGTILVVDDRPVNVTLLEDILQAAGYDVVSAADGEQGLTLAADRHPDLIISDILMPHMDGFEFCHLVRTDAALAQIPFVFLTGAYVTEEDEQFAYELGARRFLRRSIKPQALIEVVQELIATRSKTEPVVPGTVEEHRYLEKHIRRLTQKLEDKVIELEAVTEDNARLLVEAKTTEERLNRSLKELQETQARLVQSERLSAIGQLVSGVAHELNNPLAIILGYTQLILRMPEMSPRAIECLKKLEEATQRCQRIIHHLTIFAQKHKAEKRYLNVNDVIQSVLDVRADQLRLDQIEVVSKLAPQLLVVFADYQQLQQVFLSTINNAQEALLTRSAPGRMLRIETQRNEHTVVIRFIDNGPGVPASNLTRVFEPFFTTKEFGQGIGLGLSVCYGIIKEHQGDIEVSSTEGAGATFTITLPLSQETQDVSSEPPSLPKRYRLLIIDDEPEILEILSLALQQDGYEIDTTPSGVDGLKRATAEKYDLLLLDIRLPDVDGVTLFQKLRDDRPDLARHTIFITGDTIGEHTHVFLERTGNPSLVKPFDIDVVRRLVAKTVGKNQ
ncbi:MAG: response regulator [Candidatus Latescibacteria bacterium]|nr:response regulator [Candidatus Latescibacterota bacterium]